MLKLENGEELVKKTKPHSASFLSSTLFWIGILALLIGTAGVLLGRWWNFVGSLLVGAGIFFIATGSLRRVLAHTIYFTNRRIISNYKFLRTLHREISYNRIIDIKIEQGIFGKICGYADIWLYGYQKTWIVARMRGVRLGDSHIIVNRAWEKEAQELKTKN